MPSLAPHDEHRALCRTPTGIECAVSSPRAAAARPSTFVRRLYACMARTDALIRCCDRLVPAVTEWAWRDARELREESARRPFLRRPKFTEPKNQGRRAVRPSRASRQVPEARETRETRGWGWGDLATWASETRDDRENRTCPRRTTGHVHRRARPRRATIARIARSSVRVSSALVAPTPSAGGVRGIARATTGSIDL